MRGQGSKTRSSKKFNLDDVCGVQNDSFKNNRGFQNHYRTLRDGNYLIFKDAPKIETIKAGLKYIDINVLRRFSVILHCNGISSHFNIRRSLSSDSYINKSTAKHFTNLGRETFVYLLSPNLSISQGT